MFTLWFLKSGCILITLRQLDCRRPSSETLIKPWWQLCYSISDYIPQCLLFYTDKNRQVCGLYYPSLQHYWEDNYNYNYTFDIYTVCAVNLLQLQLKFIKIYGSFFSFCVPLISLTQITLLWKDGQLLFVDLYSSCASSEASHSFSFQSQKPLSVQPSLS